MADVGSARLPVTAGWADHLAAPRVWEGSSGGLDKVGSGRGCRRLGSLRAEGGSGWASREEAITWLEGLCGDEVGAGGGQQMDGGHWL